MKYVRPHPGVRRMHMGAKEAEHAEELLKLAVEAEPHFSGPDAGAWMDRLEREHDELRTAFAWFLKNGRGQDALRLAADLWVYQETRGHADESRAWLAQALRVPGAEGPTLVRARALYGAGILAFRALDAEAALRTFEECILIARAIDDVNLIVRGTMGLARVALRRNDAKAVRKLGEEALRIARERGQRADTATPLHMLAAAARIEGDFGTAKDFYRQNLALNRELNRLGWVSVELGNLGALEVLEGNVRGAVPLLREGLEIAHRQNDRYIAPYGIVWLGRASLLEGDAVRAAKLLAAAKAEFEATGLAMDPDERPEYEKGLTAIRAALAPEAFAAAWAEGSRLSLDQAIAEALRSG